MLRLIIQTKRRYKKIVKHKVKTSEDFDNIDSSCTDDESEDGQSSVSHNDQDRPRRCAPNRIAGQEVGHRPHRQPQERLHTGQAVPDELQCTLGRNCCLSVARELRDGQRTLDMFDFLDMRLYF